jgi:serine protease AprX
MKKLSSPVAAIFISVLLICNLCTNASAGILFVPGQGLMLTGADGLMLTGADGLMLTGADGLMLTGADGLMLTGADGLMLTGADGLMLTGADGLMLTGADALTYIRPLGLMLTGADGTGLQGFDTELGMVLDGLPLSTSFLSVVVAFHHLPTEADLNALRSAGIVGGTRFRNLPMVIVNASKQQIVDISSLPSVRSIYTNKTLDLLTHDSRVITGQNRVATDQALTNNNNGLPISGEGVTVAVLDTGIDATHPDLAYGSKVVENAKVLDLMGTPLGFNYPIVLNGLVNSDLIMGHGTAVAGIVGGTGVASGKYYGGMAPGTKVLGVSAGEVSLFWVLSAIDHILSQREARNIRVVNCSFGISGLFDAHDPVNIATKIMHDAGITVVFSAGNRGDQPNSLNPYSVADWVIGVGSGTKDGKLSSFSSRGAASYGLFYPTLIAPGENIVSTRALGLNVTGITGLINGLISGQNDLKNIPLSYLPRYTMVSGTSFAAPHVAGTIALMLQANPHLTPDEIKKVLQETATPMTGYSRYEVGAGYLNTHAAVRRASLGTEYGKFRAYMAENVSYSRESVISFNGQVSPGQTYTTTFQVPEDAAFSTVQVGWKSKLALLDGLSVKVSKGSQSFSSKPSSPLAGTGFQRSGITMDAPASGTWTITVKHCGLLSLGTQTFAGAIETVKANYADMVDINNLSASDQQAVKRAVRSGLVSAGPQGFIANAPASRLEAARALMLGLGGNIPQYLPDSPTFVDIPAAKDAVFVESLVNSPDGNLLGAGGPYFNPQANADRLTVAVAAVKALGLPLPLLVLNPGLNDWNSIPSWARGYVIVALQRNLINKRDGNYFRPSDPILRKELASTGVALQAVTQ